MTSSEAQSSAPLTNSARPLLLLFFFGSGCAALIYEIVWFQMLSLIIGSSSVSMGVLLGTFMGGMCLGSLLLSRIVSRSAHPLRVYAALEGLIGQLAVIDSGVELDEVRVVRLPDGKDPDEVVRDQPEAWRTATEQPIPVVEYLIDTHAQAHDLKDLGGRKRAIDGIKPILRSLRDPIVRDGYIAAAARRIGVDETSIREALVARGVGAAGAESRISADRVRAADADGDVESILAGVTPPEAELLRLLIAAPAERLRVRDSLTDQHFTSGLARSLWRGLRAALDAALEVGATVDGLERLPSAISGEERRLAQALTTRAEATAELARIRIGIDQTILRLEADRLEEAMAWSRGEIAEAERAGDAARVRALMEAERDLGQKRKALDRRFLASGGR